MATDANNEANDGTVDLPGAVIYPNPATKVLYVNLPSGSGRTSTVTISDVSGRQVWQQRAGNGRVLAIPVKGRWPAGLYVVTVQNSRRTITSKIVIQ